MLVFGKFLPDTFPYTAKLFFVIYETETVLL
jgi:hypothetical protein